ncbi:MAG: alpha-ketoacid dehydrogenase subunit beta [Fimbriimonadia bacterium]|jgi:pyruvate dehydrogenase E1 component beta subunit
MATMTYRDALRTALIEEIERDDNVFIMGEDIGRYQGTFRVTAGLFEQFREARVWDTPISEPGIVGIAIGAAMAGLRPVVEMMTMSFSILAMDQIINHAAKIHYMTGGQAKVPMVVRGPGGAGRQLSAQHSQSLEGIYAHVPGLKVVCPSTPADAKGMLKTAVRDENPVILIEAPGLYAAKGEVPEDSEFMTPFGEAEVVRQGTDLSIITWSRMRVESLKAAEMLEKDGISAEVVDVRSLLPLDTNTIFASVRKTHRALVAYEAWRSGAFGAEIAARIGESCFDDLDAPVMRVGGLNVPMPYAANLELEVVPNASRIASRCRELVG